MRRPKRRSRAHSQPCTVRKPAPSAAVAPRPRRSAARSPRPRARRAPSIVALEARRQSVLRAVTATGSRGCSGGGQTSACVRSTKKPITNEANSIVSAPKKTRSARWALSSGRGSGAGSGECQSPPSRGESGGGGRRRTWSSSGGASTVGVILSPYDAHQERGDREGCHHEEEAAGRATVPRPELGVGGDHDLSSASSTSSAGR